MFTKAEGFTLIEVMLALSILSLVCIVFLNVMISSYKIWSKEDNYLAKTLKGEAALQTIINQLRCAKDISIFPDRDGIKFRCYYRNEEMMWLKYGLYQTEGMSILGLKIGEYGNGVVDYSHYMPLINNVTELKFTKNNEGKSIYKIRMTISDNSKDRTYIKRVVPVEF